MAHIEKRKDKHGKYHYRVQVCIMGRRVSETFHRKIDAERWAAQTETDIRNNHHFPQTQHDKKTVAELIDKYILEVLPHRRTEHKKRLTHLLWWKEAIGSIRLSELSTATLSQSKDELSNKKLKNGQCITGSTVNRYLATLSVVLSVALEWEWLKDNPMFKVKKRVENKGRDRSLSKAEIGSFLKICRNSTSKNLYPLVLLAISTGARWGELVNATWEQVDFESQTILLHKTKNGQKRLLHIRGAALETLTQLHVSKPHHSNLIFVPESGGKVADIRDAWLLATKKANIPDFRFHDLRHTAASHLAMAGSSLLDIAEVLGHKHLSMVKRYAHLTQGHVGGVVEKMNQQMFETNQTA